MHSPKYFVVCKKHHRGSNLFLFDIELNDEDDFFHLSNTPQLRIRTKNFLTLHVFLVGAFSLKEKSPTITLGSFFSADNLTLNGPLFLQFLQSYHFSQILLSLRSSIFTSSKKLKWAKGYSLRFFLALRDFFSKKKRF